VSHISEKTCRVSGYVLDAVSHQPVPGVRVEPEEWCNWLYSERYLSDSRTDSSGHFVLLLPASIYHKNKRVVAQTLFYEGKEALPIDKTQPLTLLLKRNAYRFQPYGCQLLADLGHIPPYVDSPIEIGSQLAFLIRDSTIRRPYKLHTVTIRVGRDGFPQEPMRIRVYQYNDHPEAPPTQQLASIDICPRKDGILTYDVNLYDIQVTGQGFFLALESPAGADKFYNPYSD
jgi:hypothetical protein